MSRLHTRAPLAIGLRPVTIDKGSALLLLGNCVDVMRSMPSNSFDLVFADPPFNIGQGYTNYKDSIDPLEFIRLIWSFVDEAWRVCNGVLALHGPDSLAEIYLDNAKHNGRDSKRINWVNWVYTFNQYSADSFSNCREHLLVYAKHSTHVFNGEAVAIPSRRMELGDKRAAGPKVPSNVWGIAYTEDELTVCEPLQNEAGWNRVQGNNKERVKERPNQLPIAYLTRIVKAYTDRGDYVLDPFCGTGTTALVAASLGRTAVSIDVDPEAIACATARLCNSGLQVYQDKG